MYSTVLIGLNFSVALALAVLVYVLIDCKRVCRILHLQYLNTIAIDSCGCILPLATSLFIAFNSRIDIALLTILLSLSTAIASINTVLSSRSIIVNVIRYTISLFLLSLTLFQSHNCYFYILPLASATGVIVGSDILPYMFIRPMLKSSGKMLVVGGAGMLDAINISTAIVMIMAATYIALSKIL